MELGAFSVSLNVADLDASQVFNEKLGFVATGGGHGRTYLIMKNGESTIGPGVDASASDGGLPTSH
jgi:hypothetical protein